MAERRLLNSAAFSSRARRLTKPASLKKKSSTKNQIKKSVSDLIACDLLGIAKTLKRSNVCCISLYQKYGSLQKRKAENRKLGFLGYRHSEALFTFSRALSWALSGGGWLQELELGFALWERDLKIIAESLGQSTTLKRLSFANSEFGDHSLQILGRCLQECAQLEILNLSACALTDAVAPLLSNILKAHVCRKTQADWQASLRSSKGVNALTRRPKGLVALDVSLNQLSDITVQTICGVLRIGTPVEALNLKGNQLTRVSGKLLLDVMEEWAILRFVDLRDNVDNSLMGVLEEGQHLTSFSRVQAPFWMSSPSTRSRRACYKSSVKKPKEAGVWESTKPMDDVYKNYTKKRSIRPQSAPSAVPFNHQARAVHCKPPSLASECTKKQTDFRKGIPGLRAVDMKSVVQPTKRPSTSPEKSQLNAGKKQGLLSCSTSPEFAAWDHDDANAKENRLPFQTNQPNASSRERETSGENFPWNDFERKGVSRCQPEGATVLRQLDMTKTQRFRQNVDNGNHRPTGGAKQGSKRPNQLKSQTERVPLVYNKSRATVVESQGKGDFEKDIQKVSSNPPSRSGIQTTEWNSFLKEITQAIFHLQERLDELIGPADPDSLTEQATSQLQVLS
ncbi:hypothetical protein GOP47_0023951 [Adiantum capillus-veneris]|uniref:Uncharacterized protein n=1 Tax=Adiantum capillus-veneris TaxID=13818 RepID=A0A9D4U4I5_ADICA|nr:hypothetical protein GOP47_0023951 [Adiantum capillus-veneris]